MGRNTYEPQICPMAVRAGFGIDGKTPVTVSLDGNVRTWDVSTGLLLRTLENHPNYVLSAAISSDAHILAAGNLDGNVELWDVDSGGLIRRVYGSFQDLAKLVFCFITEFHEMFKCLNV